MDTVQKNIPAQHSGAKTDIEESEEFQSPLQAHEFFLKAKQRLLDINNWKNICGSASANFILTDNKGNKVNGTVQVNDHFKIDLPAPANRTGQGFDWVQVQHIDDSTSAEAGQECVAITVRPTDDPTNNNSDTAHFFSDDATSTFSVSRKGNKVTAEVHGRNEKPNVEAEGIVEKIRNAVIALGAMAGLSSPQWKSLVKGIMNND